MSRWTTHGTTVVLLCCMLGTSGAALANPAEQLSIPTPLDIERCVAIARTHSDLIGQSQGQFEAAVGARTRSYQGILPSISGSASYSRDYVDYLGIAGVEYSGRFGFYLRTDLLNIPSLQNVRSQGANLTAATADLETTEADVELAAREQFYACVAALKLAEVEERAVDLAQEQLRRSETLFRLGSVAKSDVLQARVNLAEAEQLAIQRRNAVGIEHARLAVFMGIDPRTPVTVDSAIAVPVADPGEELDTWVERAMQRRSDVAAARARLSAAELSRSAAQLQRLPTLQANAGWSRSARDEDWQLSTPPNPPETLGARYNNNWSVSLSLSVPIFSGLAIVGEQQTARGNLRTRRESYERLTKEVALEVRNSFNGIREARESLHAARTSVNLAAESLRLQQALYESGAGTLLEWDNARLDLRRARVSLIQAEIALVLAHARFGKAVGETR